MNISIYFPISSILLRELCFDDQVENETTQFLLGGRCPNFNYISRYSRKHKVDMFQTIVYDQTCRSLLDIFVSNNEITAIFIDLQQAKVTKVRCPYFNHPCLNFNNKSPNYNHSIPNFNYKAYNAT